MSERPAFVDLHSHLVPGVDDGARTLEESLEGVGRMRDAGISRIVTTPHLDGSLTRQPSALEARLAAVDEAFESLEEAAKRRFPDLELRRGHEVMLDVPDPDLTDPRLRLGRTNYVLVEWPRLRVPPGTVETVRKLQGSGLRLVIAHPERYHGMAERLRLAEMWRSEGAVLQVNYGSLVGRYGPEARTLAFRMLERGWVDCLSTDFHGRPHLDLYLPRAGALFEERDAEEQFRVLAAVNTGRIMKGEDLLDVGPIPPDRRLWSRLRGLLRAE